MESMPNIEDEIEDEKEENRNFPRIVKLQYRINLKAAYKIHFLNYFLNIITFGVYSPWANVKLRKHIYENIFLDGKNITYEGRGISLFVTRLVLLILIIAGYGVYDQMFSKELQENLLIGAIPYAITALISPILLIESKRYNAKKSKYQNVNFNFDRGYFFAYFYFISIFSGIGILYLPWLVRAYHEFKAKNHSWGNLYFTYGDIAKPHGTPPDEVVKNAEYEKVSIKKYVMAYWVVPMFFLMYLAAIIFLGNKNDHSGIVFFSGILLPIVFLYYYLKAQTFIIYWCHLRTKNGSKFDCEIRPIDLAYGMFLPNAIANVLSLGMLIPWTKTRQMSYIVNNIHITAPENTIDNVLEKIYKKNENLDDENLIDDTPESPNTNNFESESPDIDYEEDEPENQM